jgi:hypothetical protein
MAFHPQHIEDFMLSFIKTEGGCSLEGETLTVRSEDRFYHLREVQES